MLFMDNPPELFFSAWNLRSIFIDYDIWKLQLNFLFIYVILDKKQNGTFYAKIGGRSNISKIVNPSTTPIIVMQIPPFRNYHCTALKAYFQKGRGTPSRIQRVHEFAKKFNLNYTIYDESYFPS